MRVLKLIITISIYTVALQNLYAKKPNVIVIMTDDMGAEALACYKSSIYSTPRLDEMAKGGAIFRNAYATPLCTPTRVMIMSGQYPNRTGYLSLISKDKKTRLPAELKTIGNYFKDAGYKTAIAGKWQLGQFDAFPKQMGDHGFDEHCMWKWFYDGVKTSRFYKPGIWHNEKSADGDKSVYGPDVYNNFVLDFIERHKDDPFMIYYPMALVHSPFITPPALTELAHSKYPKEGLDKRTQTYGEMVTYCDYLVGKIVDKLKALNIDKDTLIIFTGDNGTGKEITSHLENNMTIKGGKGKMTEAGTRVPFICYWPGTIPSQDQDALISLADVLPTVASFADIPVDNVDGMDLSHIFRGESGPERDHIFIAYKNWFLLRDKHFRVSGDGKLFDISSNALETRYSELVSENPEHEPHRLRLMKILKKYQKIEKIDYSNSGKEKIRN